MYCDRRLPAAVRGHEVLLGECLGGALYVNDFITLAKQVKGEAYASNVVLLLLLLVVGTVISHEKRFQQL